jgi:GTP cyclohydrolase I
MTKPSKESAIKAINTLLEYIGADVTDEHLKDTAKRVISSYDEIYKGYSKDITQILNSKFYDQSKFQDVVLLKNIDFNSVCAHHMLPIVGQVSVSYIPNGKIVGISKIVKVVNMFAKRLQIQEKMTAEIAENIQEHLTPLGAAVKVSATHYCMVMRGVQQKNAIMDTYHFTGVFNENKQYRQDFINCLINA